MNQNTIDQVEDPDATSKYTQSQLRYHTIRKWMYHLKKLGSFTMLFVAIVAILLLIVDVISHTVNSDETAQGIDVSQKHEWTPDQKSFTDAINSKHRDTLFNMMVEESIAILAVSPDYVEGGSWIIKPSITVTVDGKSPDWAFWGGTINVKPSGSTVVITNAISHPGVHRSVYTSTLRPGQYLWFEGMEDSSLETEWMFDINHDNYVRIAEFRPQLQAYDGPCTLGSGYYCADDTSANAIAARLGFVKAEPPDLVNIEYIPGYNTYRYEGISTGLNSLYRQFAKLNIHWKQADNASLFNSENRSFVNVRTGSAGSIPSLSASFGALTIIFDTGMNTNLPYLVISKTNPQDMYFFRTVPNIPNGGYILEMALAQAADFGQELDFNGD